MTTPTCILLLRFVRFLFPFDSLPEAFDFISLVHKSLFQTGCWDCFSMHNQSLLMALDAYRGMAVFLCRSDSNPKVEVNNSLLCLNRDSDIHQN